MGGWQGKVLWVNLTEGTLKEEPLDPQVAKDYIGGRGLGIKANTDSIGRPKGEPVVERKNW